jgi:DNA-binding NarL/FixJ family response regulator
MISSEPLRVYILDDHPVVRDSFALALRSEPGIAVIGAASTLAGALKDFEVMSPDVVLVDLELPDRDGTEVITTLRARLSRAMLLVFTAYAEPYRIEGALAAGANGYVLKTTPLEQLVLSVRRCAGGEVPMSPEVSAQVVRSLHARIGTDDAIRELTRRERQVLPLLASGASTNAVAAKLTISAKTVETHRARIYRKLGLRSAVDLSRLAIRNGLMQA